MYNFLMSVFAMSLLLQPLRANAGNATAFPLLRQENGVQGYVEIVTLAPKRAKLKILDENKREIDSKEVSGKSPRLDKIPGSWRNGPVFLATTDQFAGFGSYSGLITRPFQVKNGHIEWAKISKGANMGHQILLMQSLKSGWKIFPIHSAKSNDLDIYEVSCFPDFDHGTHDDAKFDLTYEHFHFDGYRWEAKIKTKESCWESGDDKLPDRSAFP